jgi:hypothetical protein
MTTKRLLAGLVVVLVFVATCTATAAAHSRPTVSRFAFSPTTFSVPPAGASAASSQPATTIRFRLSEPATVTISIARQVTGRKVGHRCVKSSPRLRSHKACARYVPKGRIVRSVAKSGDGAIGFSGRLRGAALVSGRYRATIRATDRSHRRSARRTARFTVQRASSGASTPAPAPPTPSPAPRTGGFPNPSTTGVPAGWVPAQTRTSDLVVTTPGAVVQDIRLVNADILVQAPNVTIRRVDLQGGTINDWPGGSPCGNGMVVEDTTIEPAPGESSSIDTEGVISYGGYTARRVKIWRRSEGFRDGGKPDCGPVRVEDSFAKIVIPSGRCDLHSDGLQGYYGDAVTVVNTTIDFVDAACGTAPFFVPKNQGNTSATVDGLLVMGGGYPFRMGVPGTVSNLNIVNNSWGYGPIDVACSMVSSWNAKIVTITPDYQIAGVVRAQPCNSNGGG